MLVGKQLGIYLKQQCAQISRFMALVKLTVAPLHIVNLLYPAYTLILQQYSVFIHSLHRHILHKTGKTARYGLGSTHAVGHIVIKRMQTLVAVQGKYTFHSVRLQRPLTALEEENLIGLHGIIASAAGLIHA